MGSGSSSMSAPLDAGLKTIQSIRWEDILILTGALMVLHVLLFDSIAPKAENQDTPTSASATSKALSLKPTSTSAPTNQPANKPKFEPPTSFDFVPDLHTEPFRTTEPEDGNYETPIDSMSPSACPSKTKHKIW